MYTAISWRITVFPEMFSGLSETEVYMSSRFKRSLSGLMAVVTAASMSQLAPLYTAAEELAESLKVSFTSGDIDGDGKTNQSDVDALYAFLGKTAGKASADSKYDVYKDGSVDVRDLIALRKLADGEKPVAPEKDASGSTVSIEVGSAECVPGEQVSVDVNIVDWDQDLGAAEFYLDFDSSLSLVDVKTTGDYKYVSEGNVLKLYGLAGLEEVYRGTVATLTFDVPDTAYGDYDVKVKSCAVYNNSFQSLKPSTKVGLIAADVTERPLYLTPSFVNSKSMRMTWSMPYCSGELEGYIVYRDGKEIARTKETSYYDTALETGKKYVYEVQAYGADSYLSAKSKAVTAAPQAPVINAVSFPDGADTIGGDKTEVRVSMDKTVDAKSYELSYVDLQGEKQVIYSGENTALSATDIRWNIKDVPSGEYTVTFAVTDRDGASAEKSVKINVDTTAPEKVFGFDVFEAEKQMKLTWGIAAEAKVTGYNIYRRTETGAYSLLKHIDGRETLEYVDKDLKEGDIYFYMMCAVDKYGMEGIYSDEKSAAAKGDETSPEVTLFLPESGKVLSHFVTLSVKADDNVGVASVAAFISTDDGTTWEKLFEGKGASASYSFDTTKFDGKVKIKAVAYDYAGNESNALIHLYAIDNAGPAKVAQVRAVAVTSVTASIAWDDVPDDDFSYFTAKYYPSEDNKAVRTATTSSTLGVNLTDLTPDTEYTIEVAAVDIYNNYGEYSEPFTFTTVSDTNAPVISSVRPEPSYFNKSIPLSVSALDDYSIASVTIQASQSNEKDAEWSDVAVIKNEKGGRSFTASYDFDLADYKDGKLYIKAFAVDAAGNTGVDSPVYAYVIDKTAPEAPTAFKASSDANAIELKWEAYEDKTDSAKFSLYRSEKEDGEYTKILDSVDYLNYFDRNAEPGVTYFYKLTAIDAAGNESKMSKAVSAVLKEDKEAPEIISVSPADGEIVSTVLNKVSVLASDNVKLASMLMEYRLNEKAEYKTFAEIKDINDYYKVAEGTLPKEALAGETVQVRVSAVDTAGLVSEYKEVTYTVDNSKTVITEIKAEQHEDHIALTWKADENKLSLGYYVYKKANTGSWQKIGSLKAEAEKNGEYIFTDYSVNAAGTVAYKVEACSSNGMVTSKETSPLNIYTKPEASLVVENIQQVGVEYVYDATGCRDYYGIRNISINFGDGSSDGDTSAATAKFIHKYTETGVYTVTLTVTNEQGLVSTIQQQIEVIERTLIGHSEVVVRTTDGKNAGGISVYIDLGTPRQKKLTTDANGRVLFDTAAGIHTIGVFGDGYLPAEKECTILAGSGNRFDITVTEKDIVTADFKVERMKLDEIKAAGIDITAPENQHIVEVELNLTYKAHERDRGSAKFYVNSKGGVLGGDFGLFGWGGGSWGGGSGDCVTKPVYVKINPITNKVDTLITLTVPIKASFLKEFFHAGLTIMNNADEQYTISENEVKLNLPEGLTLMDCQASDPAVVNFGTLAGQETKEIDWIIRGDKKGTYDISASYSGFLDRFSEKIEAEFKPDEPITVYGEEAVSVDITVPEQLFNNRFEFEVSMTNNSPVDVYCPSTDVGAIISSAFGKTDTTYPFIFQRSIKKDGKYIDILDSDEPNLEKLRPGMTYSVIYVAEQVFRDIDGVGKDAFYESRLDVISGAVKVLNGSRIPVSLHIVPNTEFLIIDKIVELDYDPDTEFVLFVTGGKHERPLENAYVKYGDQEGQTNEYGYIVFKLPDEGESLKNMTLRSAGYKLREVLGYDGYTRGIDTINLNYDGEEEEDEDPPAPGHASVGHQLPSGYVAAPGVAGDPEDDNYEGQHFFGEMEFGDDFDITFAEDLPFIGEHKFGLKEINLPINGGVDDEGFAYLKFGEFPDDKEPRWTNKSQEDIDKEDRYIQEEFKEACDIMNKYRGKSFSEVADMVKESPNPFKDCEYDVKISIYGAVAAHYDPKKGLAQCISEGGVVFRGNIEVKLEFEFGWDTTILVASVVPVAIEAGISGEITANASFTMECVGAGEIDFTGKLVLTGKIDGEVFAGVGVAGAIAAGVYGGIGFGAEVTPISIVPEDMGVNKITFNYDVGVRAYVGPFEYKKSFISDGEIELYPGDDDDDDNSASGEQLYASIFNEDLYKLAAVKADSKWSGGKSAVESKNGYLPLSVIADNANDFTNAQFAVVDGKLVLVYLDSDSTRDAANAITLKYSVFDNEKGWSAPAQVDADKTGDHAPYLWSDGEDLYLIYQNSAEGLTEKSAVTDWTAAQNIAVSKFDTEKLTFAEPSLITNDSVYDRAPAIAEANGRVYAVWVANTDNSFYGANNSNTIMYSELGEGGWTAPAALASGLSAVTQLTAEEHNGELYTVYITDCDNDLSTNEDRDLRVHKLGDMQAYLIASGNVSAPVFAKAGADESKCLYWADNGNIRRSENFTTSTVIFDEDVPAAAGGFSIAGNRILWAQADGENASNLYESVYNSKTGKWGGAVKLTAQDNYIEGVNAVEYGGEVLSVMNCKKVTISEDSVDSSNSIVYTAVKDVEDIALTDVYFSKNYYKPDSALPVDLTVFNKGDKPVENVHVTVADKDGKKIFDKAVEVSIAENHYGSVYAELDIDPEKTGEYTVTVNTADDKDTYLDDNKDTLDLAFSLMEISAVKKDKNTVAVTVKNNGTAAGKETLKITEYPSGKLLDTIETEEIAAGKSITLDIDLTKYPDAEGAIAIDGADTLIGAYVPDAMEDVSYLLLGDVNGDGKVNSIDASRVLEEYATLATTGKSSLTDAQRKAADVNCDGKVDSKDATAILVMYSNAATGGSSAAKK